ncbi:MAG TPA: muconolactone Delta-isomerase family protein, partial [Opitutaceae bacterium]|nr:muconolactone Delta-isomerase family protein [Opitutaceae bacterium]
SIREVVRSATMETNDYLVEMTFEPLAALPSAQDIARFIERMALPTFAACEKLAAAGRIVAGGTILAAGGFIFIARTKSPAELEAMLASLPLWPRARTRVVPLGSFADRAEIVRRRLAGARAAAAAPEAEP